MAQYGNKASKNPPWARADQTGMGMAGQNQMQQSMMNTNLAGALPNAAMLQYPQQQMFQSQLGFQQQMYGNIGTVQYPTRALNSAAFQNAATTVPVQSQSSRSTEQNKERVITGTVTKLQDNFGFVDDDIFFQTSCVTNGANLRIGSRVLVEATFNPTMPFKWNAQRIQVLPNASQPQQQRGSAYNAVPPPSENSSGSGENRFGSNRFGGASGGNRMQQQQKQQQNNRQHNRRQNRERSVSVESDRKRRKPPERRRSPSRERRSRSKSRSPNRKKRRNYIPRYNVQIPKFSLNNFENDMMDLKRKFTNMYVPSDFFLSHSCWTESFPLEKPFNLDCPCKFHIFHKDVLPLQKHVPEPSDVDYLYSAKVILMALPGLEELYQKCLTVAEDSSRSESRSPDDELSLPSRLVQVLVGQRGKETMAIGGPWSPSQDGSDPLSDPGVLIKTAIRATKFQTGIDLSNCTHWFRFLEIHYHRGESVHKGKVIAARVETVVLFIPDVWSCLPTRPEWDVVGQAYAKQMKHHLSKAAAPDDENDEKKENEDDDEDKDDEACDAAKKEPTHYSELDPKNMKVSDLRDELEVRGLSPKGLKSQLVARLTKAIKAEADEEDSKEEEKEVKVKESDDQPDDQEIQDKDDVQEKDDVKEEEKKQMDERERALVEKRYKLPNSCQILVHPNGEIKSGKFNCVVTSLYTLLNYRIEDNKEHSFEMFLFAEMFNAMLMRDFGFYIYRAICVASEKCKDEKVKEKDDKRTEDRDKDKRKEKTKDVKDGKEDKGKERKPDDDDKRERDDDEEKDEDKESVHSKDRRGDDKKDDEKKKEKVKLKTVDPYLLLSFVYFDNTQCGYIVDRDLEDMLTGLSLSLSRAQVKRLLQKVVTKDSLHYRKLTDKSKDEIDEASQDIQDIKFILSQSNREMLPKFGGQLKPQSEKLDSGFVSHNGTIIDIGKLMKQLERNEASRLNTEKLYNKLLLDNASLKCNHDTNVKTVKELTSELNTFKKRLTSSTSDLDMVGTKLMRYVDVFFRIKNQIDPIIKENSPDDEVKVVKQELSDSDACQKSVPATVAPCKTDVDNKEADKSKDPANKRERSKNAETKGNSDEKMEESDETESWKSKTDNKTTNEDNSGKSDEKKDIAENSENDKDNDKQSVKSDDNKVETKRKMKEESIGTPLKKEIKKEPSTPIVPKRKRN